MRRREIKRAAWTLAILLPAYWLYATLIVPVIEPPVRHRAATAAIAAQDATPTVVRYHEELTRLFPADAWETKSPKVLRNRDTLLLFQDYQPQEDGSIKIFPCTVVLRDDQADAAGDASVLILQAPEGAKLRLSRPVDLRGAQLGQPVEGRLLGRIEIHSPGRPDGTGQLHVVTSNVQINAQRLWTPNEVDFRYEGHAARGRDLMIKLLPEVKEGEANGPQGWAGIRSIELVKLHHLHLELESSERGEQPATRAAAPPATIPVDIACAGPLRVDFVENVMTMEERVSLERTNVDGKIDSLQCDRLTLLLKSSARPAKAARHVVGKPVDEKGIPAGGKETTSDRFGDVPLLELRRVVAEGSPVILNAPSQNVQIRSHKLLYDLELGRFRLWASPDETDDQAWFRHEQHEVWAREMDCTIDPQTNMMQRVSAAGPGRLHSLLPQDDDSQPIRADWKTMLVFQKESETLYQLVVTGQARIALGANHEIEAERLHAWFEPESHAESDTAKAGESGPRGASDEESPAWERLRPQRMIAVAHPDRPQDIPVRLRADATTGITERLEVQFVHVAGSTPVSPPRLPDPITSAARTAPSHDAKGSTGRSAAIAPPDEITFRSHPNRNAPRPHPRTNPRPGPFQTVAATDSIATDSFLAHTVAARRELPVTQAYYGQPDPLRETWVRGQTLHVVLHMAGEEISLKNLLLLKDVVVQQREVAEGDLPSEPLFELRADSVRMEQVGQPQQHALVAEGQPVQIRSDKMQLFTTQMHLNQAKNLVWSDRKGQMLVRVDRDANGNVLPRPQRMTIDWQHGMEFDGLRAQFKGRVEVLGPDQRMRAEALMVQLTERLAFGESSGGRSPEIDQVRGQGNVHLETLEYEQGQLTGRTHLQVPFAQINRSSGEIRCGGPGRVVTVRRGFRNSLDLNASAPTTSFETARSPSDPSSNSELTFLQVDYQRQIDGNLNQRVVDFEDRVQVIYGPVLSWNETLRSDAPLRKNDVLLSCDQLRIAQGTLPQRTPEGSGQSIDLIARGNAYVEGQAFTARAEKISYEQAKDQLILEGTGHTDAVLSHQARIGAPRSETAARKILFWRKSQRVSVEDARMLDLSNLGL